jgi:hypothetical protein
MNRAPPPRPMPPLNGAGELSTGTGALLVLVLIWIATEHAHRKLR